MLSDIDWYRLTNVAVPIEEAWKSFYSCLYDVIRANVPKKRPRCTKLKRGRYPNLLKKLRLDKLTKWRALKGHENDLEISESCTSA
jgi:hypothetical protein